MKVDHLPLVALSAVLLAFTLQGKDLLSSSGSCNGLVFVDGMGGVNELSCNRVYQGPEVVRGTVAVVLRLYLVERKSAIGPIGHFDWDGPQRRQLFVQWTIRFIRVREPHRRGRNG